MVDRIFKTREFSARPAAPPMWLDGGASYARLEPVPNRNGEMQVVKYDSATAAQREVLITAAQLTPPGAASPLEVEDLSWSADGQRVLIFTNTRRVWRTNSRGDYWLLDRQAGRLKKLGGNVPEASLLYAQFNPGATKVAYVRQNDLYVEDLASGAISRLTRDGSDLVSNGGADWVNEEELDLHDCFRWSPDGTRIAFWQFDLRGVGNFPLMYYLGKERDIVTQLPYPQPGPYPAIMSVPYPLAGTTNSAVRVGVIETKGGAVRWMQLPGEPREHYVARLQWADARTLLVQQLNRLQNTARYLLAETASGSVREMWRDHDDAFITIGFGGLPEARALAGGKSFLVTSEKDGWMHVYRVSREGGETLVTRGAFDAIAVAGVDEGSGSVYVVASPENATQRYLYRAPLDGQADPVRVTPAEFTGSNAYTISPDGRFATHRYSRFDDPGISELVTLPEHKRVSLIDDNAALKQKVAALLKPPVEYFKVDAGDGVQVDGYMLKPADFDASKRYPVLVHIYGEPAGQTVEDRWGGTAALYHRHLASLGYLIVSFDNSGTPAPRGRAWRKAIYGAVGVLSSKQQAQALRSLAAARPYVDLDRAAVWGWSGGGTNTLNLMFRSPELYKVGMSVAPVPDQRLYDTIYQERYMGLPAGNTEGYKQASAINFAEGLSGNLLIVHGSGDDNVHYQGTELLVNRLVELGKRFDFMTYPDRTHAISEGPGTTPHLYHLLTRYLTTHLPAGPREASRSQTAPAQTATPPRPTPPTRDPNTPGYVQAKELPDGTLPPAGAEGNFIIGPTHTPAPEMTVRDDVPHGTVHNFTMSSTDSKIYPGIARDAGTFGTPDPNDPAKLVVTTSRPAPYTRRVAVYVPAQYVPGTAAPFIVGADGPDPSALHRARQPDRAEARARDDRDLHRQRQRRCAGQPARPRVRHDVGTLRGVRRDGSAAAGREAVQRAAHEGPGRPRDDGVQFRRIGGADHGVVSPRVVSPRAVLLGHVRQPAVAAERGDAARRLGVPRAADSEQPGEADSHLDAGRRSRPVQPERDARQHARLGGGQRAHGPGARGEGLSLPVRLFTQRRALRSADQAADPACGARVAVEGVPCSIELHMSPRASNRSHGSGEFWNS